VLLQQTSQGAERSKACEPLVTRIAALTLCLGEGVPGVPVAPFDASTAYIAGGGGGLRGRPSCFDGYAEPTILSFLRTFTGLESFTQEIYHLV